MSALVKILVEPKNALIKQYQKLLSFDNVRLKFTDTPDGHRAKAVQRKSGARDSGQSLKRPCSK